MSKEQTGIGSWLYVSLLIIPAIGFGLINMPHYGAKIMGANGYLAQFIAAIFVLPGIAAIYLLAKRFPGQTLIQQGKMVFGPVVGLITGLIYLLFNLYLLTMFTRDISNMVDTYYLERTPVYLVALVFLTIAAYMATRGIETIARLACFILIPGFLVMFFLMACGFFNITWTKLLPLTSPNVFDYFKGGMGVTYIYFLVGISAMTLPFLKPLKSYPRLAGSTMVFLTVFYTLFAAGATGVFGSKQLLRMAWPSLEFVRTIDVPFLLLEQAGLLLLIDWIAMMMVGTGYLYYCLALGFSQTFNVLDYKRWVWILFPVKIFLVLLPRNTSQTKVFIESIVQYGWYVFFAYPVILWFAAVVLRRKGSSVDAL